jgi:FAD/FMN-containing dehydrogenase/Fe-S oxidoreductase
MNPQPDADRTQAAEIASALAKRIAGEVRFDRLWRTLYATDASMYEIIPLGVVLPATADDVAETIRACREHGASIVPRGGGTGLTGGAVGAGVQLDLSRCMNRIGPLDVGGRTIEVEPGVVLDELNAFLAPHGLRFAPDVATSSRATLGGMIANNSCGANSVLYGRTVDYVGELTVVLADGSTETFGSTTKSERAADLCASLARIRDQHYDDIVKRFPRVLRSNGGYGLDRLGPRGSPADATKVLCGSEGTLAVVVGAKLKLTPLPSHAGLLVIHFKAVLEALGATPAILTHVPAAIELVDRLIIDAGLANPSIARRCGFLQGRPEAILIVEFHDGDATALARRIDRLRAEAESWDAVTAVSAVRDADRQADVWKLRTSGLGLLMSKPGDDQPYSFVEDAAVDPSRLRDYIEGIDSIMSQEGVHAGYYAHASVGCIHVKPVLNLKRETDVKRMQRIAEAACDLAVRFGGTITGEHGDGIVRSCWLERLYGPRILEAFRQVKQLFDPHGVLNPHKIVDPWPMTEHLRYGAALAARHVTSHLDFDAYGGMAGLASMCSGVGQCRQRLVGTMCPSYMGTDSELHTTRARANALRAALSNRGLLRGLEDPALEDVMDLCLSCKACKTECPTGVDMARLKAEFLSHRNVRRGVPRRARLVADVPRQLARGARLPRLANLIAQSRWARALTERRYGLDRRIPPPRWAARTFRSWWRRHRRSRGRGESPHRGDVVYFVDTWTNFIVPQVGVAAVTLLEAAGFRVTCPPVNCCGRPALSQGLLLDAKCLAEENVGILTRWAGGGVPIVGTEPSCISALLDEYPQLLRSPAARGVASRTELIETLLCRVLADDSGALAFSAGEAPLLYHGHCHQKALVGTGDAVSLLERAWGSTASEINSGCCGMAGAFGHEKEHYDVARAIGEQRLFPAIRDRDDARVAVSGFSCRHQIEHHTGRRARHLVEYVAERLQCDPSQV